MEKDSNPIMPKKAPHHGKNIKKVRGLREMKQTTLAELVGKSVNWLYELEKKPVISDDTLQPIAEALQVHIDILKNLTDDCEIQINYNDTTIGTNNVGFNDIEINNDVNQISHLLKGLYEDINKKEMEIYDLKKRIEEYEQK